MDQIRKIKSISIWVFIIPFISINACLIIITQFHEFFPNKEDIIKNTFPYLDGGASISRTARPYPTWLIFKPAMFLTSFLLIKYWLYNKSVIEFFKQDHKYKKKLFSLVLLQQLLWQFIRYFLVLNLIMIFISCSEE